MNKLMLAGLLALAAWGAPPAQAQIFFSRPTTPPTRPFSTDPRHDLYGVPRSTYGLFPQGVPPAGSVSAFGSAFAVRTTAAAGDRVAPGGDWNTPAITGHPTRFAAYSGYFSNQGGGLAVTPPSTTPPSRTGLAVVVGAGSSRPSGTPPSGGRSSVTPRR